MILFNYTGGIQKISDSILEAHKILQNDDFYKLIEEKVTFDFSNCTAVDVANTIKNCNLVLDVKTYKHPFGPSLGKEYPSDPTSVYINVAKRKFEDRTIPSVVNTLIHEAVHAADSDSDVFDFNHGDDNKTTGKGFSAPYWIGCLSEMILENVGVATTVYDVDTQSQNYCGW